jgi:hypothetical protein
MDRWDLLFIAGTFASLFIPIAFALVVTGERWGAAEEASRARRLAEHRMNARLLRLDI